MYFPCAAEAGSVGGGRTRTGIAITEGCCTQTLYTFLYFPLHNHLSSCKFATLVLCRNPSHCDKSRVSAHNSTTSAQVMWFNPMLKKIPAGQNYINANSQTKEREKTLIPCLVFDALVVFVLCNPGRWSAGHQRAPGSDRGCFAKLDLLFKQPQLMLSV